MINDTSTPSKRGGEGEFNTTSILTFQFYAGLLLSLHSQLLLPFFKSLLPPQIIATYNTTAASVLLFRFAKTCVTTASLQE